MRLLVFPSEAVTLTVDLCLWVVQMQFHLCRWGSKFVLLIFACREVRFSFLSTCGAVRLYQACEVAPSWSETLSTLFFSLPDCFFIVGYLFVSVSLLLG